MVDTDLPKLLKQIFQEHAKFGHRVFAQGESSEVIFKVWADCSDQYHGLVRAQ